MPYIPEVKEHKIRRAIRDAKSIDALLTVQDLADILEKKFNIKVERHYLSKLARKIDREIIVEIDREKSSEEIAQISERVRFARESLIRIATSQTERTTDKLNAWGKLAIWEKFLLDAKKQLRVFDEDKDNPIKDVAYREISDDERSRMAIAFRSLGISLPEPRKIEAVAIEKPIVDINLNEPTKQPTTDHSEPERGVYDPLAAKKLAEQRKVNVQPAAGVAIS